MKDCWALQREIIITLDQLSTVQSIMRRLLIKESIALDSPSLYSYLSLEVEADLWMGGIATSTVGCFCFASSGLEFSKPESARK